MSRGVRFTIREKERALKMWLGDHEDVLCVARKVKCTEQTLYRWKKRYDGTRESLQNKSSRPHTPHPNAHTKEEQEYIRKLFEEQPNISYAEALGVLRQKYAYSRTYYGFYRYVVKSGIRPKEHLEKYEPQPYETPEMFGIKMQMDVKYVPKECFRGAAKERYEASGARFYQYTMIDETTRERFLYPYTEVSARATADFVKRALVYFRYLPYIIQTDNGGEFTNRKDSKKVHVLDELLGKLRIKHQLIRAYTPRHNGKVERSHRTDGENFYKTLTFETYDELKEKMQEWNIRYNNRPHSSLRNIEGKRVWFTPLQKRAELMAVLNAGQTDTPRVRFIKRKTA